MGKSLPTGFKLGEATFSDLDEIWKVYEAAFEEDEVWEAVVRGCKKEDVHPWLMKSFGLRWNLSDTTFYKVTEESTGRIAGWTALQFPWALRPLGGGELAFANSGDLPSGIEGVNMQGLAIYFEAADPTMHGYNPQTDYRRAGTMIHPDFQKRGFGTCLTQHCNAIADKTGSRTWVPSRNLAVKMFRQCGFKDVGTYSASYEKWGGEPEHVIIWFLVRDAELAKCDFFGLRPWYLALACFITLASAFGHWLWP